MSDDGREAEQTHADADRGRAKTEGAYTRASPPSPIGTTSASATRAGVQVAYGHERARQHRAMQAAKEGDDGE